MAIDQVGAVYIADYMRGEPSVNMVDILFAFAEYHCRKAQDIIDECTLQAATNASMSTPDANIELRLRELVAVVMKLKELGLIE